MTDPSSKSTPLHESVQDRMAHMGMSGDLEHIALSRPDATHFFAARALRAALARVQALDLEGGSPEAWEQAAKALGEAQAMVDGVQSGAVS